MNAEDAGYVPRPVHTTSTALGDATDTKQWSATDDEPHCGVECPLTKLDHDGLLELYSANDTAITWQRDMAIEALVKYHNHLSLQVQCPIITLSHHHITDKW